MLLYCNMTQRSQIDEWGAVRIRQLNLDKIEKLRKNHPEFNSNADFVDQAVVLQLNKYEVPN